MHLFTVPRHGRKMEIKTHIFLTSALTGIKKSVSHFSCFIPAKETPVFIGPIA
jgi:hypothetical protein